MEITENKGKKEPLKKSYHCAMKFRYKGKDYAKGDKIKFTKKQADTARKNNLIK